jgi:drug/metabolite transporter (DMT)-like permease
MRLYIKSASELTFGLLFLAIGLALVFLGELSDTWWVILAVGCLLLSIVFLVRAIAVNKRE